MLPAFERLRESVASERLSAATTEELLAGCECIGETCGGSGCLCIGRNRGGLVFECNSDCRCDRERCKLRTVQRGREQDFDRLVQVVSTKDKDFGLIARQPVDKGTFVGEYAGELITIEEAKERWSRPRDSEYILTIREHFGQSEQVTIIDATEIGNHTHFINHSCEPNLVLQPVRIESLTPIAALFAVRDIAAGEEFSFDYGGSNTNSSTGTTPCRCGSALCRGFLPFDPHQ